MRCLTLADELKTRGWKCRFICRDHAENLNALIRQCGFDVDELPGDTAGTSSGGAEHRGGAAHASWLGCDIELDARQTQEAVAAIKPDWLVIDHYAIDHSWERALRPFADRLLSVDDLADRMHDCDMLLAQTFYTAMAGRHCKPFSSEFS